jgi:transposase InsO family protein
LPIRVHLRGGLFGFCQFPVDPPKRPFGVHQFTAHAFTGTLKDAEIRISMDGRGRALDNIFVERLWRTVKYEDIYIREYGSLAALTRGLEAYFHFYNYERYHQSLDYAVPAAVHLPVKELELKTC